MLSASDDGEFVLVSVEDNGIGIPRKGHPQDFREFYRVDKARSRELGGTGLGLSIVKHIVQSHGGEVSVESVLGQGLEIQLHHSEKPVSQPRRPSAVHTIVTFL